MEKNVPVLISSSNSLADLNLGIKSKKEPVKKHRYKIKILTEVTFGVAKYNCNGFGICELNLASISWYYKKACRTCNKGIAIISREGQNVKISFFKYSLNGKLIQKYFKENSFLLEENFEFPKFIQKKLKLSEAVLKSGKYTVQESNNYLNIVFNLVSPT